MTTLPEWRIRGIRIGYVEIGPRGSAVTVGMTSKDQRTGKFIAWLQYNRPGQLAQSLCENFATRKAAGLAIVTAAAPELAQQMSQRPTAVNRNQLIQLQERIDVLHAAIDGGLPPSAAVPQLCEAVQMLTAWAIKAHETIAFLDQQRTG